MLDLASGGQVLAAGEQYVRDFDAGSFSDHSYSSDAGETGYTGYTGYEDDDPDRSYR